MREIKFRAWDKERGKMCFTNNGGINSYHIAWFPSQTTNVPALYRDSNLVDECVIMQYTGLKDKNGKEIFDGDIVDINGCKNRVVEWDEDWCGFYLSRELNPVGYFLSEEYEIIGNIYENPELLGD